MKERSSSHLKRLSWPASLSVIALNTPCHHHDDLAQQEADTLDDAFLSPVLAYIVCQMYRVKALLLDRVHVSLAPLFFTLLLG